MAVIAADMIMRLSGGASNSDPNAALGGAQSSVPVDFGTPLNNLFDNVTPTEATTGVIDYRCIYLRNTNGTDIIDDVAVYIHSNTPSSTTKVQIGLDPAGIDGEATTIVNENTAPSGVTFSDAATVGAALAIGTLEAGEAQAIWIKREVTAGTAAAPNDPFTLRMTGTPA